MRTFEEILEGDYHITLEDNRRDESIKLAAEKYLSERFKDEIIKAHSDGMKTVDCRPEYSEQYYKDKFAECECQYEYNDDHHPLLVYQCPKCDLEEIESDDFKPPCDKCDGNDACDDFGCAIKLGLSHLVKPTL